MVYGSGFENRPELVEIFEKESILLGNSSKILRKVRDWDVFFETLRRIGIPHPESKVVKGDEARALLSENPSMVIKPIKSGGGHAIYDRSILDEEPELDDEVLVQEFVRGVPASATVLATKDGCYFIGATEQLIGDGQNKYRYVGNIAPLYARREVMEQIARLSIKIVEAFKLRGSNTVDFILSGGVPVVTEVNPRLTGAMEVLERAFKINLIDLHVKACMDDLRDVDVMPSRGFQGKKILFADDDLQFRLDSLAFVKDVPRYGEKIAKGSPICTVLGSGNTRRECIKDLERKETIIRRGLIQ